MRSQTRKNLVPGYIINKYQVLPVTTFFRTRTNSFVPIPKFLLCLVYHPHQYPHRLCTTDILDSSARSRYRYSNSLLSVLPVCAIQQAVPAQYEYTYGACVVFTSNRYFMIGYFVIAAQRQLLRPHSYQ